MGQLLRRLALVWATTTAATASTATAQGPLGVRFQPGRRDSVLPKVGTAPERSHSSQWLFGTAGAAFGAGLLLAISRFYSEGLCETDHCGPGTLGLVVAGEAAVLGFIVGWNLANDRAPADSLAGPGEVPLQGEPTRSDWSSEVVGADRRPVPVRIWLAGSPAGLAARVQVPLP